jgi:RNA 2',3'-cyclic 3'-phosphodiesterase
VRLFVALDIPEDVRAAIAALTAKLRSVCGSARWVRIEGAHVTLKFIGEVPQENVEPIQTALRTVPFPSALKLIFRGVGFFPNERRPRVLWAGIEAGPELRSLANAVETALEPLGIAREQREFSPHLTLARFDSPEKLAGLRAAIAAAGPPDFGQAIANEFHLYQSVLKRGGAEYTRLATFRCVA